MVDSETRNPWNQNAIGIKITISFALSLIMKEKPNMSYILVMCKMIKIKS